MSANCVVEGCDKPGVTLNKTLCSTHYRRWKHGRPLDAPIRAWRAHREACIVDGCTTLDKQNGYCPKHWGRVKNNGSPFIVKHQRERNVPRGPAHPKWNDENVSYNAAHLRVRKSKGSAKEHVCVDCTKPAKQWSYTYTDPNERRDARGAYSGDSAYYVARCVSCHKRFDIDIREALGWVQASVQSK